MKSQLPIVTVAAFLGAASIMPPSAPAREKWPAPDEATKRQMAEDQRAEEETWKRVEPQVAEWAKKGKPYLPQAGKPQDLPQAPIPAFPGAEGAGRFSFGGRGGKVYVVTSLEDDGRPGTFREACEAAGPRVVVFNVAGIIRLKRALHIRAPYITIAGQSAPGDGVCVADRSTLIDTHDVVIRYMRFRRGAANVFDRDDALGGNPVGNIVVDHCSCSWGFDENLSLYRHVYEAKAEGDGAKPPAQKLPTVNLTVQWTISSEALDTYNHAFGGTWGGRNSSFHHNLFACNTGRNPSVGMGYDFNFTNNVLFNWRHRTCDGGDETTRANLINNYLKPGPATPDGAIRYRLTSPAGRSATKGGPLEYGQWYVAGNVVDGNSRVTSDNWDGGVQFKAGGGDESTDVQESADITKPLLVKVRADKPFPLPQVALQPAAEAYESVLANSGATLPRRDPVDDRIIDQVRTGKVTYEAGKGILTDISQVGGYPQYKGEPSTDSDADGMPDWWETKYGLNPCDPSDAGGDCNGDGYTNVEKYLNGIDPSKRLDYKDPKNNATTLTAARLAPPADAKAANATDDKEVAYTQSIEKRTQDILAALDLKDSAKVHDAIIAQYRALRDWHDANDGKLKDLAKQLAASGAAGDASAQAQVEQVKASLKQQHDRFIAALAAELSPAGVETVKDKMTYNKVKVTYDAYCEIVPGLTDAQKAKMLELLKEAREEAMDGGSADEKSAVFKRYKGKINNYLTAQGHDVAKAYKDWGEKQKSKAGSAPQPTE